MQLDETDACSDCVVIFLLDDDPGDAIVIDADESAGGATAFAVRDSCRGFAHRRRVG